MMTVSGWCGGCVGRVVSCCGDFRRGISGFLHGQGWLFVGVVDFVWSAVIECGVTSPAVVELLNVGDEITPGLCLRRVNGSVDALVLQCREERFGHCVIPTHTPCDPLRNACPDCPPEPGTRPRCKHPATVRVPDRGSLDRGRGSSVSEDINDERSAHVIGDRPADDLLQAAVDDGGQVERLVSVGRWLVSGCGVASFIVVDIEPGARAVVRSVLLVKGYR